MSLGIYPIFRPRVPEAQFNALGEVLAANFEALDRIANTYGVPGLSEFGDSREVPPDFDGSPEDLDELLGPCEDWFDPTEGKTAFQALADAIAAEPDLAGELDEPDQVVAELEELARVLKVAERRSARFRLEMS